MSDEEIIEELTYKLDMTEHHYFELMDKYNKQKEEIERLKNAEEYAKLGKETLLDTIHKQQKEIEYYKYELEKESSVWTKIEKANKCISKDKIIHTLLKFQNEYGEDLLVTDRLFIGKEVVQYGEDMLDEIAKELDINLLEEE